MLALFKKPSSKQHTYLETIATRQDAETNIEYVSSSQPSADLAAFEDEGLFDVDEVYIREPSQLPRTLADVLNDKSALSYFVQFMESRNALSFLRCWLDIDNFHAALQHHSGSKTSSSKSEHDSLSVSTDGDSSSLNEADCVSKAGSPVPSERVSAFVDDALGIFKKYIALEAPDSVHCSEAIRNGIVESICSANRAPRADCFDLAQLHVAEVMAKDYFDAFLQSDYFCKHQIDVLTSGRVVLDDILGNETALFYFMEFLEQENNRFLLEFWLAASNFQQQLRDHRDFLDPVEAQSDAVILYDKYFSLQALCPLGFGDKVRCAVENHICGEHGLIDDCFGVPLRIVEQLLDRHYLKPFLASQLFCKFLSELINAVPSAGSDCICSDCGSEKSCSTPSAFLAMEMPTPTAKSAKADMSIDSRQLYDPDALWKRKKHARLALGHVTPMGQFVTDVEPEPDKQTAFNIRSVVKRLVKLDEEDKRKEELAWQVAEMIVKSITSVTLADAEQNVNQS